MTSTSLGEGTRPVIILLYLSDVPTTEPEQVEFFEKLKTAIRNVLNISMESAIINVTVIQDHSSVEIKLGLTSNAAVRVVISFYFLALVIFQHFKANWMARNS
jgi:hypothetical protein